MNMIGTNMNVIQRNIEFSHRRDSIAGITLVEVIFSIGVMLVGLVGLVAIIPVAGQQSADSISATAGSNLALSTIENLQDRRFLSNGRVRPVPPTTAATVANLTTDDPARPVPSYCYDPMFASSTTVPANLPNNSYNQSLFPYYNPTSNIFADPSSDTTAGGYTPWPAAQPRLVRAGLARDDTPTLFVSAQYASESTESVDDLIITRPRDKSLDSRMDDGNLTAVNGGLTYGKRITSGQFSWFATVDPFEGQQFASASVVVMRNRERLFDIPLGVIPPSTPDGNAVHERITYVTFASGFSGGAGGLIHIVGNANTVDDVNVGDWVMLSRFLPGPAPRESVHRWFRVLSHGGRAERFTTIDGDGDGDDDNLGCTLPGGGPYDVWRRKLLVEGPDWSFNFDRAIVNRNFADGAFDLNTYATLVEDVVGVVDRTVSLDAL